MPDPKPELIGFFYAWWRGDPLPALPPLPGLISEPVDDERFVATLMETEPDLVRDRVRQGQRPWAGWVKGEAVGWGWVGSSTAAIGELGLTFTLPAQDRYLWDFVTRPAWRGRGVYTTLLQSILVREGAERYWIGHDWGNIASARGIEKAGFERVGAVYRLPQGGLAFVPRGAADRATAAAELLGLPMVEL